MNQVIEFDGNSDTVPMEGGRQSDVVDLSKRESHYVMQKICGTDPDGNPFEWNRGDPPTGDPNHPIDMILSARKSE